MSFSIEKNLDTTAALGNNVETGNFATEARATEDIIILLFATIPEIELALNSYSARSKLDVRAQIAGVSLSLVVSVS